ncbi:MAG: hypothetical protein ABSF26_17945 [Thermoguttaceae bacterium]|jgi:hypothetical protein
MQFSEPNATAGEGDGAPAIGVALLVGLFLLLGFAFFLSNRESGLGLSVTVPARPSAITAQSHVVLRLAAGGKVMVDGLDVPAEAAVPLLQGRCEALAALGSHYAQATLVIRAAPDLPAAELRQWLERVQRLGFHRCVLEKEPRKRDEAN